MSEEEYRMRLEAAYRDEKLRKIDMLVNEHQWDRADAGDYVGLFEVRRQVSLSDSERKRVIEYEKKYRTPVNFGIFDTPRKE